MHQLVLVAYATRYGSTEQTARVIAEVLREEGLAIEIHAVDEVQTWRPYSGVVLAAALYIGRLHGKARAFLQTWRGELIRVPVALVVPGPIGTEEKDWVAAREQLDKELARVPWFHPATRQIVGGKWDPARLGFPFKWTLRSVPARDARDWEFIRSCAREIAGKLEPALVHSGS